jgi:hypothetical protein
MNHIYSVEFYDKETDELVCYYSTNNLNKVRQMEKTPLQNAQVQVYRINGYRV